jgi:hypothetical protein
MPVMGTAAISPCRPANWPDRQISVRREEGTVAMRGQLDFVEVYWERFDPDDAKDIRKSLRDSPDENFAVRAQVAELQRKPLLRVEYAPGYFCRLEARFVRKRPLKQVQPLGFVQKALILASRRERPEADLHAPAIPPTATPRLSAGCSALRTGW